MFSNHSIGCDRFVFANYERHAHNQLLIAVDIPGFNQNSRFDTIHMFEFIRSIGSINAICTIAFNACRCRRRRRRRTIMPI